MRDGVTGFIVDNLDDAVDKAQQINTIDRQRCRQEFEDRFSARRMAKDYLAAYHAIIDDPFEPRLVG
jgi:glycosyltransferase involved in cell wall biosynthesis